MEVILTERIEKLGQLGEKVTVKPGFARNFLLPKGKAVRATNANKKLFQEQIVQLEAQNLKKKTEAEALAKKMDKLSIVLIRQAGESGQLYGSVTKKDAAIAISEAGFLVERNQIQLKRSIKALGLYNVSVTLHPEVNVEVIANIARSADEAKSQKSSGKAVLSTAKENENVESSDNQVEAEIAANEAAIAQAGKVFEDGVEIKFSTNDPVGTSEKEGETETPGSDS